MRIYVGNLSSEITEEELRQEFEAFGEVEYVNIITDRISGRPKWFGFVDDLELLLDEPNNQLHLRAASRVGRSDFEVNRQRVEQLRLRLLTATISGAE